MNNDNLERAVEELNGGGVAVIPTDTIYGIVARSLDPGAVERLYQLKGRDSSKPFIILVSSAEALADFEIELSLDQKNAISKYWPGPVSLIFDCPNEKLNYLHRSTNSLAFRIPNNSWLLELLSETGPLSAPSANPEGQAPAHDINQARDYFNTQVSCYVDGGEMVSQPSRLIKIYPDGREEILRP